MTTTAQAIANIAAVMAPAPPTPTSATPIAFVDIETTSLHPERRAWEIAVIRRDETGTREHRLFVKNVDLTDADPFALKVGGFYERHPQYASTQGPGDQCLAERYEAAVKVERWTRGATIVGINPSFDTETLAKMLRSLRLTPAWSYHLVDVANVAAGWLLATGRPFSPTWRSDELAQACGVDPAAPEDRHTALGDARWAMRWLDTLADLPGRADVARYRGLANAAQATIARQEDTISDLRVQLGGEAAR